MRPLFLLFGFLFVNLQGFTAEQIYFKIAVSDNLYSTFISNRATLGKSPLDILASRMREEHFNIADVETDYYDVKSTAMTYDGRSVIQYDMKPKNSDRFRQVLIVDSDDGSVVHKDVYDNSGKLVFSFTSLEKDDHEDKPAVKETKQITDLNSCIKGFCVAGTRVMKDGTKHIMLSDGLNKFSVFEKKVSADIPLSRKIVYGNYVMRKKVGDALYTVVGTIPFSEMEFIIENYAGLEEKK
ncbi:MAG: MucB/RseB C-terminal domain-containing protein [Deferribacterales bacterium]